MSGHADSYHYGMNYVNKNLYGHKNWENGKSGQERNYLKKGETYRSAQIVHTNITTIYLYGRRDKKEVASLRFLTSFRGKVSSCSIKTQAETE